MAMLGRFVFLLLAASFLMSAEIYPVRAEIPLAQSPLFFPGTLPPINMLVMGRDHTLYYEAYNDASDLNGDGVLDVGYKPDSVTYFGYFDSNKCYTYDEGNRRFNPASVTVNKKCSGQWSGDFLNYVTTARIDALRKVLYGGRRVVDDDAGLTVLERSYIPQDAHSWGKEYQSVARDGYDISQYTPLSLPATGKYHLFANTTLLNASSEEPLMRVLTNSTYRIWEWVAIEQPVAGDKCGSSGTCVSSSSSTNTTHPSNHAEFTNLLDLFANAGHLMGTGSASNINCTSNDCNPYGSDDNYITVFRGNLVPTTTGDYVFSLDGDDATEVIVNGTVVFGRYTYNACTAKADNCKSAAISLTAGVSYPIEYRHEEVSGGDKYVLWWKQGTNSWEVVPSDKFSNLVISTYDRIITSSKREDYIVRVKVCDSARPETNCKQYPSTYYKPTGLLHDYGESDRMLFGLITGSYGKNMSGGVLRKNIESFKDEVNASTGQFTSLPGIVRTLDQLRIVQFGSGGGYAYPGRLDTAAMTPTSRNFFDWGNPIGEMMYESLRYFSGKSDATADFKPTLTSGVEKVELLDYVSPNQYLLLPAPTWKDPYTRTDNPRPWCTASAQLVISDINPSYDTDQVPGTSFGSFSGDISGFNATTEANAIWAAEHGGSSQHFIGQSGTLYDGAPTAKTVTGLGTIRGLAPAEPTKQGGYYSSAVARYAYKNDIRSDLQGDQKIQNFSVALASPLPKMEIPVGTNRITIVPFAKSVDGLSIKAAKGEFQPTNQIVDFFVEKFANTDPAGSDADSSINSGRPYVRFRINYEDTEQGADHDMDAIVVYEVIAEADNTLTVNLFSEYAAGSIEQHMGYVISGTTRDGVYLEVRDCDTANSGSATPCKAGGNNPSTVKRYFLDTPPATWAGECAGSSPPTACNVDLPLIATRRFTPSSSTSATLLKDPLWYAAKYGSDGNDKLAKGVTSPNYFLVTNASTLQTQLEGAFKAILGITTSSSAVATNSTKLGSESLLYQARFKSDDWTGELRASPATAALTTAGKAECPDGTVKEICWDAGDLIPAPGDRKIWTLNADPSASPSERGIPFLWDRLADSQKTALKLNPVNPDPVIADYEGQQRLAWLRGDLTEKKVHSASGTELTFRKRSRSMGDIVSFNPVLVKADYFGYELLPSGAGGSDYLSFYEANKQDRAAVVYVGANDGMLHAFDATTGVEKFAYLPGILIPELDKLTKPGYAHRYYVNGQGFAGDAYLNGSWKTVLVASLGAGGRGIFALDVTNPDNFGAGNVLWEFTAANDPDMGYVMTAPLVVRMKNGEWAAVFGNGYNSASQQAFLFIVNLQTGALIKKIPTGRGLPSDPSNGLAPPELLTDETGTVITAYAGDLLGNLWKFDLSAALPGTDSASGWRSAFSPGDQPKPLFTAVSQDGEAQPITERPAIIKQAKHDDGGYIVMFGTGRYFEAGDNVVDFANEPVQSLYGIWDKQAQVTVAKDTRITVLQEQTIVYEGAPTGFESTTRVLSQNPVDWTSKKGWFVDLWSPIAKQNSKREGERVVLRPVVRGNRVIFTSLIPSSDPCVFGGDGWYMEIDAETGGRVSYALFDLNNDAVFDQSDFIPVTIDGKTVNVSISGLKVEGIPSLPTIIRTDQGVEIRVISTTATSEGTLPVDSSAARAAVKAAADAAAAAAAAADTAADAAAAAARSGDINAARSAADTAAAAAAAAAQAARAGADAAATLAALDPAAGRAAAAADAAADAAQAAAAKAAAAAAAAHASSDPAEVARQASEAATQAKIAGRFADTGSGILADLGDPRVLTQPKVVRNMVSAGMPDLREVQPPRWRQVQ